jgi:hypothetical protein
MRCHGLKPEAGQRFLNGLFLLVLFFGAAFFNGIKRRDVV